MATLYRKYRPQTFKEVVGQNHVKITLENEVLTDKVAQAYLFCGPRAVGKTTMARVLSKAINCTKRKDDKAEPCNKCESCLEITVGRSLDIIEIDAASHTGVDNVRDNIIASARVAPSKSKYKVFIIDEVHMLSISAFNALLKIIEEPPANVVFILCTTEIHKVPTTIISRCQRFDFKRISVIEIAKKLAYICQQEEVKIDKNILESVARKSEGYMRDAESLLGQIISIGGKNITQEEADLVIPRSDLKEIISLISSLAKKDSANGIKLVNGLVDGGVNLKTFTDDLIEILRKIMLGKINPSLSEALALELGESLEAAINEASQNLNLEQLIKYIERFIIAKNELRSSFIMQLPLELAIIELCLASSSMGAPQVNQITPTPVVKNNPEQVNIPTQSTVASSQSPSTNSLRPSSGQAGQVPSAGSGQATGDSSLPEITDKWSEVLNQVKKYNHSLSFILRVCQPRNIEGNQLCLAFKYKFHKDRVNESSIKNIIDKVLNQVYGAPVTFEAIIDENLEVAPSKLVSDEPTEVKKPAEPAPEQGEQGNAIDNLLKTFGGKIVS